LLPHGETRIVNHNVNNLESECERVRQIGVGTEENSRKSMQYGRVIRTLVTSSFG